MTKSTFVFIPFWVETALQRNSCAMDVCLDYSQIRCILSLEDMSGLLALQDCKSVTRDESALNRTLLTSWNETAMGAQRIELDSTIIPLARSNELKDEICKRLQKCSDTGDAIENETVYYKLVDISRDVAAMVVYPGFPEYVSKPENEYKVLVDQLKIFYVYMKLHQVSLLPIFRRYVLLLQQLFVKPAVIA